jgi:hypothetical protein
MFMSHTPCISCRALLQCGHQILYQIFMTDRRRVRPWSVSVDSLFQHACFACKNIRKAHIPAVSSHGRGTPDGPAPTKVPRPC